MIGLNTIQDAWARSKPSRPNLTETETATMEACFYAGASACLRIVLDASRQAKPAFNAILEGLTDEVRGYVGGWAAQSGEISLDSQRGETVTRFRIPLIGTGLAAGRRAALAIELGKAAAEQCDCAALLPYLVEALQHVQVLGVTEEELRADVTEHAEWWHQQMHDKVGPADAARKARGE